VMVGSTPNQYVPIDVIEMNEFSHINVRSEPGTQPYVIYYRATAPNGTIYPYPYPENSVSVLANKLELFTRNRLDEFPDLFTEISLPPGYKHALIVVLATWLCEPYEKSIPVGLASQARQAMNAIAAMNSRPAKISTTDTGIPYSESY
jgi:hypothetical protein